MRKWLLHIFCVGMWCMLTASCSQIMDEPTNGQCDEPRKIVFTLALDAAAGSRATWGENESDPNAMIGTDWENQIAPNQLQVAFYNSNNAYLGKVENLTYFQTEQKNIYRFMGDVPETGVMGNNDKLDCKIMVFANIDEEINENANLANLDFAFGENVELENIPMWGIKKVNQTLRQGEWNELGTIYLLRAVAKVEVSLDDNLSNEFELQGVTLNRYTTTGFTLPTGWNAESTDETTDLNTEDVLNFGTEVDETPLPFTEENGKYIIYMPEYVNTDEQITSSNMTVFINNNEYPLEFKYYSEDKVGQAFDVVRNHYYEYTITGVSTGNEPSLTVSVENWDLNQETLSFQDYVSVGKDGQIAWFEGNNTEGKPITPVKSNSGDKAYVYSNTKDGEVTCTFNISTPVGGTWYASLIGSGEDTFAFEFNDASQLGTDDVEYASHTATMATGKVGMGPITLTIKTVSDRPKLVNNEAILQIYVETYDRRTIAVKELLNQYVYSGIDMCTLIQIID